MSLITSTSITSTSTTKMEKTYHILGEDFTYEYHNPYAYGSDESYISIIISSINIMGKPFYDDLKKQGINIPDEIDNFINERFKILERDNKISKLISSNKS